MNNSDRILEVIKLLLVDDGPKPVAIVYGPCSGVQPIPPDGLSKSVASFMIQLERLPNGDWTAKTHGLDPVCGISAGMQWSIQGEYSRKGASASSAIAKLCDSLGSTFRLEDPTPGDVTITNSR